MPYLSLSDYGWIGNQSSTALVSRFGSIDWCCFPDLDSPSHFSALLDDLNGGRFQIIPVGEFRSHQRYLQRTQVLETTFETPFGRGVLLDWMPMSREVPEQCGQARVFRKLEVIQGKITWLLLCTPRFHYARDNAVAEHYRGGVLFRGGEPRDLAWLESSEKLEISASGASAVSRFTLESNQTARFSWQWGQEALKIPSPLEQNFTSTVEYWREYAHRCNPTGCGFAGPWHDIIARSTLTLKLLTHPAGAIAESATTSIPGCLEVPAGSEPRTWDYRYAWIRDSAQAIQALAHLGYKNECNLLFEWLCDVIARDGVEGLQPVYRLDGGKTLPEEELPYLAGYQGMKPVRVGNLTSSYFQLDIFGHVMLAAAEYYQIFKCLPDLLWPKLVDIADYVCQAWRRPDHGTWEMRSKPEHHTVSKVYCWAALDRAITLAQDLGERVMTRWQTEKTVLFRTILAQGFDHSQNCFVRAFGDTHVDSSTLLIPILGFLPIDDERVTGTLNAVQARLSQDHLVQRYEGADGLTGSDGFHMLSSLLFVQCLALAGKVEDASARLSELCAYATPLGFLGEQVNPVTGEALGNFPSASVHIGLINSALYLSAARNRQTFEGHLLGFRKTG